MLYYFSENIIFFVTPSKISSKHYNRQIRVGGMVVYDSVKYEKIGDTKVVHFRITDTKNEIRVKYDKQLPALFAQGQGVVIETVFNHDIDAEFSATLVLAKHDEVYMSKDAAIQNDMIEHNCYGDKTLIAQ